VYFTKTGMFRCAQLEDVPDVLRKPEIRMTLDYEEDFQFFKNIIEHFAALGQKDFTLRDMLSYLERHPEVVRINQSRQQEFLDNQKKKTKLILRTEGPHG